VGALARLLALLTPRERRQAGLLLAMILIMAMLDVIGVASIMPFITVLGDPGVIESNALLGRLYRGLGYTDPQAFLFFLGTAMLGILLVSIVFKSVTTYAQLRFIYMREYSIGRRLVEGYLHQPYEWFLNRNSSDLGKAILSEVAQVINNAMMPTMLVITQGALAVALLILLVAINPLVAAAVGAILGLAYGSIYVVLRGYLSRIGAERLQANEDRFGILGEAFGGIKEVKVTSLEGAYTQRFEGPARRFATHQATSLAIAQLPRFALEGVAFGGMLIVVLYLLRNAGGLQSALPILAVYAFAGYRLLPALQQVYGGMTQLRFAGPALHALHAELSALNAPMERDAPPAALPLQDAITLRQVVYTYPNAPEPALNDVSISIRAGSTIGFVGATGSGKTTAVDLILGLLEPASGAVLVDGVPVTATNRRSWQRAIGYVPQHIFLADASVAANIAFGVEPRLVNQQAVEEAARIANLHDFVVTQMPQGYATTVGERGVRLSGGQRQRIGVARALYHKPRVLILDEATSALDNLTEQAVMDAVNNLSHEITVILVAHRLTTVRACDQIYMLRRGRVVAQGTFDQLTEANETFRAMSAR
jgi:ABC-type multidrug transport system fused ATPase/permease subunit